MTPQALSDYTTEFPVNDECLYLNHAAGGPLAGAGARDPVCRRKPRQPLSAG